MNYLALKIIDKTYVQPIEPTKQNILPNIINKTKQNNYFKQKQTF